MPILAKLRERGTVVVGKVPGLPKMSDTLASFAEPLLDGAAAADYEATLDFAAAAWNALPLCDGSGREPDATGREALTMLRDVLLDTGMPQRETDEVFDMLSERKRSLFPDDPRIIVGVSLRGTATGGLYLEVGSMLLRGGDEIGGG